MEQKSELLKQCAEVYRIVEAAKEAAKMGMTVEQYLKHIGEAPVKNGRVKIL